MVRVDKVFLLVFVSLFEVKHIVKVYVDVFIYLRFFCLFNDIGSFVVCGFIGNNFGSAHRTM